MKQYRLLLLLPPSYHSVKIWRRGMRLRLTPTKPEAPSALTLNSQTTAPCHTSRPSP
jgi:hypothetical protein